MSNSEIETLLRTLQAISPMPEDEQLVEEPQRIDQYFHVVETIGQEIGANFDPDVIKALLYSFGPGDGFETYWTTLHYIETFRGLEENHNLIRDAASNGPPGARKWSCLLLGRRRDPADLPFLILRLSDTDIGVICEALHSISMIASDHQIPQAIPDVENLLNHPEAAVSQAAEQTLESLAE